MLQHWYEIYLGSDWIKSEDWQALFAQLKVYLGWHATWRIYLQIKHHTVHYYLVTPKALPASLGLKAFLFRPLVEPPLTPFTSASVGLPNFRAENLLLSLYKAERRAHHFRYLECTFEILSRAQLSYCFFASTHNHKNYLRRLMVLSPAQFLSINFGQVRHLRYKKIPKYLDSEKVFRITRPSSENSLLLLDAFPYAASESGIELSDFDFAKHSLIIGGSGSGKSRFLSLFVSQLWKCQPLDYKVLIIDPHDALKYDLGAVESQKIIDFRTPERSVDLFCQEFENPNVAVELMLETFRTLIGDSYNGRLERVLRHSIYLLLIDHAFTFSNLRQLLSDTAYRNQVVSRLSSRAPSSVSHFFLTEFQELRSQAYNQAFAPIIAFIDEMQMVPVLNQTVDLPSISNTIEQNFLSVFSLSRLFLGDKPTRVISGLLMQQIFLYAQQCTSNQHLMVIIDEVAVVENPILMRFLSEMRKYNVSVVLAGQYFGQISASLRAGILANVSNYYIFRVSRSDADLLRENVQLKLIGSHDPDDEKKLFTGLKARECLVQICRDGELYSLVKARTPDHNPVPNQAIPVSNKPDSAHQSQNSDSTFAFSIVSDFTPNLIMRQNSTNRKPLQKGKVI